MYYVNNIENIKILMMNMAHVIYYLHQEQQENILFTSGKYKGTIIRHDNIMNYIMSNEEIMINLISTN